MEKKSGKRERLIESKRGRKRRIGSQRWDKYRMTEKARSNPGHLDSEMIN